MDKSKFTVDPHLDGDGHTYLLCACGLETRKRCAEIGCPDRKESNPKGWQEVDGVTLPETQREAYPGAALVGAMLQRRINATSPWWRLSDPKCAACPTVSPWSRIEQRDLDTVHQLWLAERITPQGGF